MAWLSVDEDGTESVSPVKPFENWSTIYTEEMFQ